MSKEAPEFIRIAGVLYKKAPKDTEMHTAQNVQQHLLQFQNAAEKLSGALAKLEQAAPLVQQKVAALKAPLENANKAVMGKQFPQALQLLTSLKPQVADFQTGLVGVIKPLLDGLAQQLTPQAVDSLIEDVNTVSALASAEGAGFGVESAQPAAPTAPAPSGVAAPTAPAAPAAPAPAPTAPATPPA